MIEAETAEVNIHLTFYSIKHTRRSILGWGLPTSRRSTSWNKTPPPLITSVLSARLFVTVSCSIRAGRRGGGWVRSFPWRRRGGWSAPAWARPTIGWQGAQMYIFLAKSVPTQIPREREKLRRLQALPPIRSTNPPIWTLLTSLPSFDVSCQISSFVYCWWATNGQEKKKQCHHQMGSLNSVPQSSGDGQLMVNWWSTDGQLMVKGKQWWAPATQPLCGNSQESLLWLCSIVRLLEGQSWKK